VATRGILVPAKNRDSESIWWAWKGRYAIVLMSFLDLVGLEGEVCYSTYVISRSGGPGRGGML